MVIAVTSRFQTELATNAHVVAPDVANTHIFASDAYRDISGTETVPDVLHDVTGDKGSLTW